MVVPSGEFLRKTPENTLNDLDGKEWVKATKSWFVINPRSRSSAQLDHPAKFPEELVKRLVGFFTKKDSWVLDPFAGVGSTSIACKETSRNSVGIELNEDFAKTGCKYIEDLEGNSHHYLIVGDAKNIVSIVETKFEGDAPKFDYLITSPPYWDMLRKSRGGSDSVHKEREEKGLKLHYSESSRDLGNIEDYDEYIEELASILGGLKSLLKKNAYLTIIVQNMRDIDGRMRPIAWDLARRMSQDYWLQQELIWCQDNKKLGIWGYPTTYVSNVHHHYCLVFQNR
ncbi:MAG: site-specific DNA-methyltransferase [Candidatus Thorarchaeota archaeon]|nr:MAG: site-specific DNA-methyltransferase [Candidatus Thorarchaeota archaeon]